MPALGEVSIACLRACDQIVSDRAAAGWDQPRANWREIAAAANVAYGKAEKAIENLRRSGALVRVAPMVVAWSCKPMMGVALAAPLEVLLAGNNARKCRADERVDSFFAEQPNGMHALARVMGAWGPQA